MEILLRNRRGKLYNLLDLQPEDLTIDDLARSLAMVPRFGAQTIYPYSVATHSCLVSDLVSEDLAFDAICHDLTEGTGINDMPQPIKVHDATYKEIEGQIAARLAALHGFRYPEPDAVRSVDQEVRKLESYHLQNGSIKPLDFSAYARRQAEELCGHEYGWRESYSMFLETYEWAKEKALTVAG